MQILFMAILLISYCCYYHEEERGSENHTQDENEIVELDIKEPGTVLLANEGQVSEDQN